MKRERKVFLALIALVLVTAAAAVHLSGRTAPAEGALRVEQGQTSVDLPISGLELTAVQGFVVNGKGDVLEINGQGLLLSEFLASVGMRADSQVTVTAEDEYSVSVSAGELSAPDQVYLILQDDGGMRMVVFGDANSKRNVSDIARVTVE